LRLLGRLLFGNAEAICPTIPPATPDPDVSLEVMMYRIEKTFHFSAAHQLTHIRAHTPDHKCARLHGHNYMVRVTLEKGTLDADGFVLDYGLLAPVERYIDTVLDHQNLNDVLGLGTYTSAEAIAHALYERFKPELPLLAAVAVSESPDTWAEFRP
jgi:6-pyruvoyltetrahydropterin/6-carboxytetrahydropterin synthase